MKKNWLRSVISIVLAGSVLLGIMPITVFAESQLWNDYVNTNFEPETSANQWEEIERNTETVLRNPSLYGPIDGLDLKGAEVAHDKNSRTYLLEDDTYLTRYFDDPITYTDKNGEERDIDNTLKSQGTVYTNTENAYNLLLPQNGQGIIIENNGYILQLKPQFGNLENASVKENAIRYNNVADGIDLQYTANGNHVKEDIILNKPTAQTFFSYELMCEGLFFQITDNVLYAYRDGDAEPIFTIMAPYMTDNAGAISQLVALTLEQQDGKRILTVTPDQEWLYAKNRAYPIVIDPVIQLNESNLEYCLVENGVGIPGYDAGPNVQHVNNPYLFVGFERGNLTGFPGLTYGMTRSYIKINYDFSTIPANTIVSAKLKAYTYAGTPSANTKVFCQMVVEDWKGTKKTWNNKPLSINYENNEADVSGGQKWVEWDISTPVREWKNGSLNYGLALTPEYENQDAVCFSGPGNQHGNQAMYFDISWTVPNAVDENMALNAPVINLRPLTETDSNGKQSLNGVFADGVVRPTLQVHYRLNDVDGGIYSSADYGRIYPDSTIFEGQVPFTIGFTGLYQSNWQSKLFMGFSKNILYNVYAQATNGTDTTPEGISDSFIVYQFTEQDTLPYIANFYGVELSQIIADNRPQDYLGFAGNTFFIRNPQKNATIPYTRPDNLLDEQKRALIYANLGRGMYSEFDLEPVNVNIGNYYFQSEDAVSSEYNGTFSLTRSYNAIGDKSYGVFGNGWSFQYAEKLSGRTDGNMVYVMGDGKEIVFHKNGDTYVSPNGYYLNLQKHTGEDPIDSYYTITKSDGTVSRFNCYGLLESITDRNGFATTVQYDSHYHISGITTASGRQYSMTTDIDGQITSVRLPNGGLLKYEYENGNLISYTNADEDIVRYVYNENGQMTEWYDGNNNRVIQNEYDELGRIIKQTDALGNVSMLSYADGQTMVNSANGESTIYFYDDLYRTTKVEGGIEKSASYNGHNELSSYSEMGKRVTYEYDSQGNLTKQTRADGSYQEITYGAYGNARTVRDYDGSVTTNTYDTKGNLLSVTKPDGSVIAYTYDQYNQVTSLTDGNGVTTEFVYSSLDSMTMTDGNGNQSVCYYDAMGRLISQTDANGNETKTVYSRAGKKLGIWKTGDIYEQYLYDGNGNCIEIVDSEGYKSIFTYDANNRMLTAENPLGGVITYRYDANGNKISETDTLGKQTEYSYDEKGRLLQETDPAGRSTVYAYDENGQVVLEQYADGTTTAYTYDPILQLPLTITDKSGTVQYAYDSMGRTIEITDPDGFVKQTSYDAVGNIASVTEKNGLVTSYTYDKNGNLLSENDTMGGQITYAYDAVGNLTETTDAFGNTVSYTYDKANRLVSQTDVNGGVTCYNYDVAGNMIKITFPDGSFTEMRYDKNGNLVSATDGNGNTTQYRYNGTRNLIAKIDALGNAETYTYDTAQNLIAHTTAADNTTSYAYDSLGQVVKITDPDGYASEMIYDTAGNMIAITAANGSQTKYSYNSAGYLVKTETADGLVTEYEYDSMGRVTRQWDNAGNIEENTYDCSGNLLTKTDAAGRVQEYTYDLYNNIIIFSDYNGDVTKYSYDLLSRLVSKTEANGRTTNYTYDAEGNLLSETDADDVRYTYQYDALSQLIKTIDPMQQEVLYGYDKAGNLISETDTAGNQTQYAYSKTYNLLSVTDANEGTQTYEYDADGRVAKHTTAQGNVTEYVYDGRGNVRKMKNPLGYVTEYQYDGLSNLTKRISPQGAVTTYRYNHAGLLLSETDASGAARTYSYAPDGKLMNETLANGLAYAYEYDILGRVVTVAESTGLHTKLTYDSRGNVHMQSDQDGNTTEYEYDNRSRLVGVTQANGAKTKYTYDVRDNLISVLTPNGGNTTYAYDVLDRMTMAEQPLTAAITYTYDQIGQVTEVKQGEKRASAVYDGVGNQVSVTDALGNIRRYSYDKDNRLVSSTDSNGATVKTEYDAVGHIIGQTNANGNKTSYGYDGDGNLTKVSDALGNTTQYRYDSVGRLTEVTSALGTVTEYGYDAMGNVTLKTAADGSQTRYAYDLHNQLTSITSPDGTVESFVYDLHSRLEQAIKPDGSVIAYNYNNLHQLVSKTACDESESVTYGYDAAGNRVTMEDESGQTNYTYDVLGRVTAVTDGKGRTVGYSYDAYGRISEICYPEGRAVAYTYDLADNLLQVEDSAGETTQYTYDKNGNVLTCVRSSGVVTEYTYDAAGQVLSVSNTQGDAVLSAFSYTYDANGQIIAEKANQNGILCEKTFTYDAENQLRSYTETIDGVTSTTEYSYSETGNRTAVTKGAENEAAAYVYNAMGQLVKESGGKNGTVSYRYDENGNLIEKSGGQATYTYAYDIENRLKAVREGGALLMAASYDGDGNRTFQITRQVVPFEIGQPQSDTAPASFTCAELGSISPVSDVTSESQSTDNPHNDASSLPDTTGAKQDEVNTYYEKVYEDPGDSIFWYGFGQGMAQLFGGGNTALSANLSDEFTQAWSAKSEEYRLVLHSEVVYSQNDMDTLLSAGLSEKEIAQITGNTLDVSGHDVVESDERSQSAVQKAQGSAPQSSQQPASGDVVVIPSNPSQATRIDYELTYYVNDINAANAQALMTYGRNDSEKAVYTYGNGRISEDDLQTETLSDYLYDGRGSVVQTTVGTEPDLSITYDPFGAITSGVDTNFVGFAYNGEESNQVTGLQYLRARYYDTGLGSFLTIDSYLGSLTNVTGQNRYTYANNNPVNNIDPSGHYSVNVSGTEQYYQSTGLNELRDFMTAAALWSGQVNAQNGFNRSIATAYNTSMFQYSNITGIAQATANNYIYNGIAKAGQVSMNYGCSVPAVSNAAAAKFANNVNAAKNSANTQISNIKANKKAQYDAYVAYQAWLAEQQRLAEQMRLAMGYASSVLQFVANIPMRAQAETFFNTHFGKNFTVEDLNDLSETQRMQFFNQLSKYISILLPDFSVGSPSSTIPLGSNTSIYYQVSTTADLNNYDVYNINLQLQNQKLVFGDFSAKTGIQTFQPTIGANGSLSVIASSRFGNHTANLEFKIDTVLNKVNAEFSIASDLGNNISVGSTIGMEKQNSDKQNPKNQTTSKESEAESQSWWDNVKDGFGNFGYHMNRFMNGLFGKPNSGIDDSYVYFSPLPFLWRWLFG